jgi:enoyl-CoA hydratase/carnithine racemase
MLRTIVLAKTMELLHTADLVRADAPPWTGLVNHVCPIAEVEEVTSAIACLSMEFAPVVHRVHKQIAAKVLEHLSPETLTTKDAVFALSPYEREYSQEGWRYCSRSGHRNPRGGRSGRARVIHVSKAVSA